MATLQIYPRYERHAELTGVGESGQRKLLNSKILVVGAGGLGSPVLLYLAASGVGHITIIDDDDVKISNLQRQILFDMNQLDSSKVSSAHERLRILNPDVSIDPLNLRLTKDNVDSIGANHDLIIDCSDNFDTRYLLNDFCSRQKITLISGSIIYYDGQLYVFKSRQKEEYPCYRCLFPVQPQVNQAPTCAESAVLGPVPGVIGTMMAVEVLKELLGIGETLAGYFISYSGLTARMDKVKITKNKVCSTCMQK
jgi:molybdopterin/thiamine biosynthesis adenylyltransferase